MLKTGCARKRHSCRVSALVAILLLGQVSIGGEKAIVKENPSVQNPHGDPGLCSACHAFGLGGRETLSFGGHISQLCESCHDGRHATHETHPVDLIPSGAIQERIPSDFPLQEGRVTCLTCHDVAWRCTTEESATKSNRNFLRGAPGSDSLAFCFHCHIRENYQPFNVHDQLEAGKTKTDTCLWCHINVPEVGFRLTKPTSHGLRSTTPELCSNCHSVPTSHPAGDPHMHTTPSAQMRWYMSAYEMEPQMHLSFKQLLEYVQAANRAPQSIPLDEQGRITCWSCHNPHEKGLKPRWDPRSVGAEPKKATNHRLRAHEGDIGCRACHQK